MKNLYYRLYDSNKDMESVEICDLGKMLATFDPLAVVMAEARAITIMECQTVYAPNMFMRP